MPATRNRQVTLVLCIAADGLLGALPAFSVASPYWQEVADVVDRAHAVHGIDPVVLRILDTEAADAGDGGAVAYLAQVPEPPQFPLREWPGDPLRDHPLRLDYAKPGGPQTYVSWAAVRAW